MNNKTPSKVAGDLKLLSCSQRQMAAAIGLSTTRVNELVKEKIMVLDDSRTDGRLMLFDSLQNYFLSKKTTGDGVNFWTERALHEKVKRELSELKLSQERGELYQANEVESTLLEMVMDFRNKLLSLGHQLAPRLEGQSLTKICAEIDSEIEFALKELSDRIDEEYT